MDRALFLKWLDERLYQFLSGSVDIMPMRLVKLIAWFYTDARVRKLYLKRLGVNIGENTYTNLGFRIVSDDYEERAFIGKNVSIAPNVTLIVCSSANNGDEINRIAYVRDKLTVQSRIVIEDEVWIGANVTILPGVCVGRCAVVGAGSLVVKDVEPYTIVAGTPAKPIRKLDGL